MTFLRPSDRLYAMKIMLAQINPCIGDFIGNLRIIIENINIAVQEKVDVILFPELATVGYPPRDLLYRDEIWKANDETINSVQSHLSLLSEQITVIVGGLDRQQLSHGRVANYNAAWILDKHFGRRVVHKRLLPCYDIFDETRYFTAAIGDPYLPVPIAFNGDDGGKIVQCDVLICEDICNFRHRMDQSVTSRSWMSPGSYGIDPVSQLRGDGPIFVLNGSPFWEGKIDATVALVSDIVRHLERPVLWCNEVGGYDDIIMGGYSMGMFQSAHLATLVMAPMFETSSLFIDLDAPVSQIPELSLWGKPIDDDDTEMYYLYRAICLGVSNYARVCGFKTAIVGSSGGIDSAVVLAIATDVFGPGYVTSIGLPSPYSSGGSIEDARTLAKRLGIRFEVQRIDNLYREMKSLFLSGGKQVFNNPVADENLQPRIRGAILMCHSNEDGSLLLTTGNKSELSVGYCTVYGDMCGGYGVISDLWKGQVFALARFINKYLGGNPIPLEIIEKEPSAELKPDQRDSDSLPPYSVLDAILAMMIEEELPLNEIMQNTTAPEWVNKIARMVTVSEHKRQVGMALGPKVKERAFGTGRRIPIAMELTL